MPTLIFSQGLKKAKTIHHRHMDVGENQINPTIGEYLKSFPAIACFEAFTNLKSRNTQSLLDNLADRSRIVAYQ